MNQRKPNMKPASLSQSSVSMSQLRFFKNCVNELEETGKQEAAFYFEQLVDHIQDGGALTENQDVSRVLGL